MQRLAVVRPGTGGRPGTGRSLPGAGGRLLSQSVAEEARNVIVRTDPDWLHGAIADVAALSDQEAAYAEMRAALREYGMDAEVADEVVQQFARLVYAFRRTPH